MAANTDSEKARIASKVVVSGGHISKRRLSLLIILLILVLAVGGAFAWQKWVKPSTPARNTPAQNQAAIAQAQSQASAGNTSTALETLGNAINNTTDPTQKNQLYIQQGNIYANDGNSTQALRSYQAASQYGKLTYEEESLLGQTAQLAGDKQLAISYYKKAIELIPSNYPLAGEEKQALQNNVTKLEGNGN